MCQRSFRLGPTFDSREMSLPPTTAAALVAFDEQLTKIEALMGPLESIDLASAEDTLAPIEHAKLCATVAYSISSLFYMFLQTQGVAPATHPIAKDLARVQSYFAKIQAAETGAAPTTAAAAGGDGAGAAPTTRIDKAAAGRFVNAHLKSKKRAASSSEAGGEEDGAGAASSSSSGQKKAKKAKRSPKPKGQPAADAAAESSPKNVKKSAKKKKKKKKR